jgi:uracil-DNA glycosylase
MDRDSLKRHLEFYRDLGIRQLNIPPGAIPAERQASEGPPVERARSQTVRAPVPAVTATPAPVAPTFQPGPPRPAAILMPTTLIPTLLPETPSDDALQKISDDIGDCRRCRLCEKRNKIVFGSGNPQARLVFVGEGPGADEDETGLPFVGRAGQLLTQMINGTATKEGLSIRREDVYICNVVKCRPPENRTPMPDEMEICGQFLFRQLLTIRPKAICVLGGTAAKALLGTREGITKLRGNWQNWQDIQVMPTYHPSFLLRPYSQNAKRESWEDLKKVLHYVFD